MQLFFLVFTLQAERRVSDVVEGIRSGNVISVAFGFDEPSNLQEKDRTSTFCILRLSGTLVTTIIRTVHCLPLRVISLLDLGSKLERCQRCCSMSSQVSALLPPLTETRGTDLSFLFLEDGPVDDVGCFLEVDLEVVLLGFDLLSELLELDDLLLSG